MALDLFDPAHGSVADYLEHRARDLDSQGYDLQAESRALLSVVDALRLQLKPASYPTDYDMADIRQAVANVREGRKARDHHGKRVGSNSHVRWHERMKPVSYTPGPFIHYDIDAPYARARRTSGSKLWHLSDEDIERVLQTLRDCGCTIVGWWRGGDGVSVRFELTEVTA